MKNTIKRLMCIMLTLIMLLSVLVACKRKNKGDEQTSDSAGSNDVVDSGNGTQADEYDENGYLMDKVGKQDFGGKEIRILGWSQRSYGEVGMKYEEISKSTVGQEVYNRDMKVQARLNVKIKAVLEPGDNSTYKNGYIPKAETMVAGNEVDGFAGYSMSATPLMVRGYLTDLTKQPYIDLNAPWWSADLIERATIYDRLYFATGSIAPSFLAQGFAMFFNKSMADIYLKDALAVHNAETLYDMVDNKSWTIDNFITLAKNVEITGSTKTENETYGYVCQIIAYDPWYFSAGLITLDNAADGSVQVSDDWSSAKAIALTEKLLTFFNSRSAGAAVHIGKIEYTYAAAWTQGKSLFTTATISSLPSWAQKATVADSGIGVLPMPMWESTQESYKSTAGFYFTIWSIARNSDRQEELAAVMECLASEGYRLTEPALYDETLKIKSTGGDGGEDDRRMIDIVRDSIVIDAGRIHNNDISGLGWGMFRNSLMEDIVSNSSSSTYASYFSTRSTNLAGKIKTLNDTVYAIESIYGG